MTPYNFYRFKQGRVKPHCVSLLSALQLCYIKRTYEYVKPALMTYTLLIRHCTRTFPLHPFESSHSTITTPPASIASSITQNLSISIHTLYPIYTSLLHLISQISRGKSHTTFLAVYNPHI